MQLYVQALGGGGACTLNAVDRGEGVHAKSSNIEGLRCTLRWRREYKVHQYMNPSTLYCVSQHVVRGGRRRSFTHHAHGSPITIPPCRPQETALPHDTTNLETLVGVRAGRPLPALFRLVNELSAEERREEREVVHVPALVADLYREGETEREREKERDEWRETGVLGENEPAVKPLCLRPLLSSGRIVQRLCFVGRRESP